MSDANFSGFSQKTLDFLEQLKANNNRDWFADNKKTYESEFKKPAAAFSSDIAQRLTQLTGAPHHSKVFRIFRDVRFSKDKTPYNAHLHVSFTPDSSLASPPMWFFGLGTEKLSLGCGVFAFDKVELDRFRARVDGPDGEDIARMLRTLEAEGARISTPDLKRVPTGFAKDHPHADLLRHKGLSAWLDFDDRAMVCAPDMSDRVIDALTRLRPVYDCLLHNAG